MSKYLQTPLVAMTYLAEGIIIIIIIIDLKIGYEVMGFNRFARDRNRLNLCVP
jgi:hypothetical protein